MRKVRDGRIHLSAGDLAGHLGCRHLTTLDLAVAEDRLEAPSRRDPALELLQERGLEHEREYLRHLRSQGRAVVEIAEEEVGAARERTLDAMSRGVEAIAQATLANDRWLGRADLLLRVERASRLGAWSYEVVETKLARETRAGAVLQLCLYSDLIGEIQGELPEWMQVVPPGVPFRPEAFRVLDFMAYYRFVKGRLEGAIEMRGEGGKAVPTYPDPTPHCEVCRWWSACDRRRRADDHLCFVAGISKLQTSELKSRGLGTLAGLAALANPLPWKPRRGATEGYLRVGEQARLQLAARTRRQPVFELLPVEDGRGLARLPAPSSADIFLDLEGDPFAGTAGHEYLFGYAVGDASGQPHYCALWGLTPGRERTAFETFVAAVMERWSRDPALHIYHYAPYEPAALKRLMGRYATCEDEVDRMLRAHLFVDLHSIVRHSLRAGVEAYSIKDLEVFYGYRREQPLAGLAAHRLAVERSLELGRTGDLRRETVAAVEAYNRDDCVSAMRLRDWLESLRDELAARGEALSRPEPKAGEPPRALDEKQRRARDLMAALTRDVLPEPDRRSAQQQARWLLAHMLEWHRREDKAAWWEYYRLGDLTEDELLDEKAAISRLSLEGRLDGKERAPVHRYRFPPQDTEVRADDELHSGTTGVGTVEAIDMASRTIDIRKRKGAVDFHPTSVFAHKVVPPQPLDASLLRLGEWMAAHDADGDGPHRAARDLLLSRPPRLRSGFHGPLQGDGEEVVRAARRLASELDRSVLPVQGPPGSGKTYTGARMICELVRAEKRVGVTAVSHKVIRNLLDEIERAAREEDLSLTCVQKVTEASQAQGSLVTQVTQNSGVTAALAIGAAQVGAGTAWLWSREECREVVDVLFVDEAGQMSLANVLAVAQAARSIVLLGDPQQLEQPQQGHHPEGTGVSALEHLLQDRKTVTPERGLFLEETWRLHPALCAFTSELFYDGRLRSRLGLERQRLAAPTPFEGAGLWFVPVPHHGNQNSSPEEVDAVCRIATSLLGRGGSWIDQGGAEHPVRLEDILVVAPYNAQVSCLAERLPRGARVGTVDKFQGQEAPVVVYSMTTSSPEEAPRGMEFLYSLNRLNVATSRARCACILVANPRLFEPECRTPREMRLANAHCRFLEMARVVPLKRLE